MFRHQLLGLLRDGKPHHGYALVKEYIRRTGVDTNSGYAYRDLQKLVEEGLVETAPNEKGADRRRRPYQITEAGRRCFDEWFEQIPAVNLGSDGELAARAIFFEEVDASVVGGVLDRWFHDLWRLSCQIERQLEFPPGGEGGAAHAAILERRMRLARLELAFLEDLRGGLDSPQGAETDWREAAGSDPRRVEPPRLAARGG